MKKAVLLLFVSVLTVTFTSCEEEEEKIDEIQTTITVKVTKDGKNVSSKTVGVFDDESSSGTNFPIEKAKLKTTTDSNGVATFNLTNSFNLDKNKTKSIYFVVFEGKKEIEDEVKNIKKGDKLDITINLE